ncbi:MFS transporter [Leifsonia sp. Leaf264]|uniref:MFS transporter n=1 Tax=Leifsonia sp. Leaf264 TaxID=1736314 RepID=UPI0006F95A75|nr:MFS transporter [Leifsonia sp. Leaf264]KQP01825.1 transporter [Leifsonia sp. Leaf264]
MSQLAEAPAEPSAIRETIASPLYRGATVAMFLSGLGFSGAAPQIASFLVNELHASLTTAGLFYLTNLTAPVVGYLVGARSDRTGKRLGLFRLCALAGFLGWLTIAFSSEIWMPFVISAVVLAFAGAATSQLFAAIHDDLEAHASPVADGVTSIVRMALTAGWIVGPVVGSFLAAAFGPRTMLVATAVFTLAQILPLGFLGSGERTASVPDAGVAAGGVGSVVRRPGVRMMLPLLTFTGLYVLVYAGEPIKYGYLPIYMNDDLHLPAVVSGAVIGIQPLVELILMPVAVIVARRMGIMHLMIIGAAFGVAANLCFALTSSAAGMFAGQICMGAVWGVFAGLGIVVAQRLLSGAIATASAVFMSAPAVASALGGLTGGLGVGWLGLPLVFLLPAAYAVLATFGIAVMSRSRHAVN